MVVPHSFVEWTNKHDINQLIQTRWQEHVIEDHLLSSTVPCKESQEMLLKHRFERARLEMQLYEAAVSLLMQSSAGHAACKLISPNECHVLMLEMQVPARSSL